MRLALHDNAGNRSAQGPEMAGAVGFQTLPTLFVFSAVSWDCWQPPLYGSPAAARAEGAVVQPLRPKPLQHRVELEADKKNREGRDPGSLESGQVGSLRSSSQGLRIKTES